jgi:hypothetical protein
MSWRIWWCSRCQKVYRTPIPAMQVTCKYGHRMKHLESEEEIVIEKAKEGVT